MSFTDSNYLDYLKKNNDVVISTPGAFFFFGEHSVVNGQPALYMPIPKYTFTGVSKSNEDKLDINLKCSNPDTLEINDYQWNVNSKKNFINKLEKLFEKHDLNAGYDIKAISDFPPECGLNSSGSLASGISVGINILEKRITPFELKNWNNLKSLRKLKKNKCFNKIFKLSWEIDEIIQTKSSGIGPFASLVGTKNGEPIIYILGKDVDIQSIIDNENYYAFYLSELNNKSQKRFSENIFSLMYSNQKSKTEEALKKMEKITSRSSDYAREFTDKLMQIDFNPKLINPPLSHLLELERNECNTKLPNEYFNNKINGILGGYSLIAIGNFLSSPMGTKIEQLMNVYQSVLSYSGVSTNNIDAICNRFFENEIGAKLTGSGGGGDILLFSTNCGLKTKIEQTAEDIGNKIFHFKSWEEDDLSTHGSKIEKINKYFVSKPIIIDNDEPLETAYIVVLDTISLSFDGLDKNYNVKKKTCERIRKDRTNIIEKVNKTFSKIDEKYSEIKNNIRFLVLPEFSLFPNIEENSIIFNNIMVELKKLSKKRGLIIIGGTYEDSTGEEICPIISPNGIYYQYRLNKTKRWDGDTFEPGAGIQPFISGSAGCFHVMVCYDITSIEFEKLIRKFVKEKNKCHTIFIPACNPDKRRYIKRAIELSDHCYSHVLIADSFKRDDCEDIYCKFFQPISSDENNTDFLFFEDEKFKIYEYYPKKLNGRCIGEPCIEYPGPNA